MFLTSKVTARPESREVGQSRMVECRFGSSSTCVGPVVTFAIPPIVTSPPQRLSRAGTVSNLLPHSRDHRIEDA